MVTTVTRYRGKRPYKRVYASRGRRKLTLKNVNRKVKKIQSMTQTKQVVTQWGETTIQQVPEIYLLNNLLQGNAEDQRDGNQITATSVNLRFSFFTNDENVNAQSLRVICFWDRQPNGLTLPDLAGDAESEALLLSVGSGGTLYNDSIHFPINIRGKARYKVFWDKLYDLPVQGPGNRDATGALTSVLENQKHFTKTIKLNRKVTYIGNDDTIAGIGTGALYMLTMAENASGGPTLYGYSRFNFKDM